MSEKRISVSEYNALTQLTAEEQERETAADMLSELRASVDQAKYRYLGGEITVAELQSEIKWARKFAAELGATL
jgi:hypothetical protein